MRFPLDYALGLLDKRLVKDDIVQNCVRGDQQGRAVRGGSM